LLAAGSGEGITLWDTTSGAERLKIATDDSPFLHSPLIAFSADGALVATAGSGLNLWNTKDGAPRTISNLPGSPDMAYAIAFSPADQTLVVAVDDRLRIYDVDRNQQRVFRPERVYGIAFSPDGRKVAAGLDDGVAVIDLATGQIISRMQGINHAASLAFSPQSNLVAMGDGCDVLLWSPSNGHSQRITAPGGRGYSWPLPVVALGFWSFAAWYIWSGRTKAKQSHPTTLADLLEPTDNE
jgi:WD40 repeat protein